MRYGFLHIAFLLLALSADLMAQTKKEIDSLLNIALFEVYEHPDKSIAVCEKILKTDVSNNIKVHALIIASDAYSSKRDYRKSLEYTIRANKMAEKNTNNTGVKVKILTKMAIQYQQLKIYDKAIQNLDEVLRISENYPYKDSIIYMIGNNYTIRGFIYKEQFNCDIAIDYFDKAIAVYTQRDDKIIYPNLSIVAYNKGNCYIRLSDYEAAKNSFSESINFAKATDAKSLLAFAQKGLAEVYTLEGKYKDAIALLTEAESISNDVGDLVLNLGIYKGLSENYLAVNQWESYRKFQQLYLDTQQKLQESERKSVSDSLKDHKKIQGEKCSQSKSMYVFAILAVIVFAFLAILLFVIRYKKDKQKIVQLQKDLKKLQQKPAVTT